MKTIEEKAKAYDIAFERAKEWSEGKYGHSVADTPKDIAEYLFPELAESDDEKTRKQIMEHIMWSEDNGICATEEKERWIAWLEKQGEQKPAWSEEDNSRMDNLCHFLEEYGNQYYGHLTLQGTISWLKSLRPQKQNTTSKEFEDTIREIKTRIAQCNGFINRKHREEVFNLLDSLRPQSHWKPSDEQMNTLLSEVEGWTKGCPKQIVLESLYNDLNKLREE